MDIQPGQRYRHYKGNTYVVIAVGLHHKTQQVLVVYQGEYDDPDFGPHPVWIRPRDMFEERISIDGRSVPRFALISPSSV